MDKRKLHHFWTRVRPIRTWYLIVAFAIALGVSVFALRQNNLHMIQLRNAVTQADKDNTDVEGALRNLREFVYAHMNTNLESGQNPIKPPIQLKYTYDRLVAAEQTKVSTANQQIYTDAQNYCQQQIPDGFSGRGRVPCIQDYVNSHGMKALPIPDALYKFDFVSPTWSPDLAGWSLVVTVLLGALIIIRFSIERLVKTELNRHA